MQIKNISEVKAQLSTLLELVQKGEVVLIVKAGKPIAKIVAYQGLGKTRKPGMLKGRIKLAEDFDELPDDIARAFGALDE